jgi:hypothetical protein
LAGGSNPSLTLEFFELLKLFIHLSGTKEFLNTESEILKEFEIQIKVTVSAPSLLKYGIIINASKPFLRRIPCRRPK